jgi:hypothetical protein
MKKTPFRHLDYKNSFQPNSSFKAKRRKCVERVCNEQNGRQRAGFKRRERQVFIVKDNRRRQVAGSRGRQKVIHRGSKKATIQAGKRLVTSSGRSGNRLTTGNPIG